ncbi:hypothetical protein [Emticicia agri]|uniref:hypothetical protein n=1 Tax=Emticicia agri TaxID=2492393 RepID=UPI0013EBD0EA|nr:hypothetical protein [Emticicia agri]
MTNHLDMLSLLKRQRGTKQSPDEPKTTFAVTKKVLQFHQYRSEMQTAELI